MAANGHAPALFCGFCGGLLLFILRSGCRAGALVHAGWAFFGHGSTDIVFYEIWSEAAHFFVYRRPRGSHGVVTLKLQRQRGSGTTPPAHI